MKQQQDNNINPPGSDVNWIALFIACAALPLELLLHDVRTFGVRSAGPRGGGAVLVMLCFAMCYTGDHAMPLSVLTVVIGLLATIAHISAMMREEQRGLCHSRYNGRPYALAVLPMSEERMKRMEPLLGVLLGWGLHHWNGPLGTFLMTSASCQGFRVIVEFLSSRTHKLDLNDAMAEQSASMHGFNRARRR